MPDDQFYTVLQQEEHHYSGKDSIFLTPTSKIKITSQTKNNKSDHCPSQCFPHFMINVIMNLV